MNPASNTYWFSFCLRFPLYVKHTFWCIAFIKINGGENTIYSFNHVAIMLCCYEQNEEVLLWPRFISHIHSWNNILPDSCDVSEAWDCVFTLQKRIWPQDNHWPNKSSVKGHFIPLHLETCLPRMTCWLEVCILANKQLPGLKEHSTEFLPCHAFLST